MKKSIRVKLTLLLIVLMAGTLLGTVLFLQLFIQPYFEKKMKNTLVNAFHTLAGQIADNPEDVQNAVNEAGAVAGDANVLVIFADREHVGQVEMITNINENGKMKDSLVMIASILANQVDYQSGKNDSENYYIIEKNHDNRMHADYYDLTGKIQDTYYVAIRRSVAFVEESTHAAVELFVLAGVLFTVIGTVAMMLVASRFSKPIQSMASVAEKMQELDFDAKVTVKGEDELAALGNAMNDLSTKLEHTISELKRANLELSEDIEKKEAIDEMRKEFLSHVSHELKTPIALIQGYAEGLQENVSDDAESRAFYCDVIIDEANKMNALVKQLLSLNELEFGHTKLDVQRFDVVALVNNIIQASDILLQDAKGTVTVMGAEPIYVWADEFRISEVFTNYLTNAIHHVTDGGEIRVSFTMEEKEVKIQVYNDGALIPEDELDKIWVKFYKVDKARTRTYGGSGIGLSIVAATMEAHNKRYGVENMENGVAFYFCLDADTSC